MSGGKGRLLVVFWPGNDGEDIVNAIPQNAVSISRMVELDDVEDLGRWWEIVTPILDAIAKRVRARRRKSA